MNRNQLIPKQKLLLLISMLACAWGIPTTASAADTLTGKGYISQLLDGDVHLAPVGQRAGLHMTFTSPSDTSDAFRAVHADRPGDSSGGVHLSVRMPWK